MHACRSTLEDPTDLEPLETPEDLALVFHLIQRHAHYTYSRQATSLLETWPAAQSQFVRIMSRDYKRALQSQTPEAAAVAVRKHG